jgi:hypothetical protein
MRSAQAGILELFLKQLDCTEENALIMLVVVKHGKLASLANK